jgi:hypothetical protein
MKAAADPFAYENYVKDRVKKKIEEKRSNRIVVQKRLPKVNKEYAWFVLLSSVCSNGTFQFTRSQFPHDRSCGYRVDCIWYTHVHISLDCRLVAHSLPISRRPDLHKFCWVKRKPKRPCATRQQQQLQREVQTKTQPHHPSCKTRCAILVLPKFSQVCFGACFLVSVFDLVAHFLLVKKYTRITSLVYVLAIINATDESFRIDTESSDYQRLHPSVRVPRERATARNTLRHLICVLYG